MFDCALTVLYHLDDIIQFLDKFGNIMSGIRILDCSFFDMELFKPVFCATALIGIHIEQPLLYLLLETETNYDTLLDAFPKLHQNLTDTEINICSLKVLSMTLSVRIVSRSCYLNHV